jgi:hypothetical protein
MKNVTLSYGYSFVFALICSLIGYAVAWDLAETSFEVKAISKKHAFYHPITKEFTWIDESCDTCGRSMP